MILFRFQKSAPMPKCVLSVLIALLCGCIGDKVDYVLYRNSLPLDVVIVDYSTGQPSFRLKSGESLERVAGLADGALPTFKVLNSKGARVGKILPSAYKSVEGEHWRWLVTIASTD